MSEEINPYAALLEHSYSVEKNDSPHEGPASRLEYLSDNIFDFATYDSDMSSLFAHKAVEVCQAINDGTTFAFITDPDRYQWYLIMCNMPFFAKRLEWGTSIRGAWWNSHSGVQLNSFGIYVDRDQQLDMSFTSDEWKAFIEAIIAFAAAEMTPP